MTLPLFCFKQGPDDCDFDDEAGWCVWRNVEPKRPWYLQSGQTSSLNTGPERDNGGLKGGENNFSLLLAVCFI